MPNPSPALFATALLFATACLGAQQTTAKTPAEAVREHLQALQTQRGFPGAVAAWIDKDGTLGEVAVGHTDAAGKVPLRTTDRLMSGSIGKTYVAAVALQLVGEGKLDLDAPSHKAHGQLAWYRDLPNGDSLTLRHLLQHTSGIPEHVWFPEFQKAVLADPDRALSAAECLDYVRGKPPVGKVGDKWSYADTNYLIVGLVIEAATGKTYNEVLRERILVPNKLADTVTNDARTVPGLANGFATGIAFITGDTLKDGKYQVNPAFEGCGGGLSCTTADLARWGRLLFAGDVIPAKLHAAHRDGVPADPRVCKRYGLGCFVLDTVHGPAWGHSGIMPGYLSILVHYRESGLTVALQFNTDDGRKVGNLKRTIDEVAGILLPAPAAPRDR